MSSSNGSSSRSSNGSASRSSNQGTFSGHSRRVALIVGCAFFMVLLDASIIATSLPEMARTFGVPTLELSIGISAYLLATAAFIPLSGWLADRFGARRIFLIAIVIFTLTSLGCGGAQTLPEFILWRALQGIGGALMTPVGRILVLRSARKHELLQATALITWPALFAPVVGPVIGGMITTYVSWRWNFYINVPLGILGFLLVLRVLPRQEERRRRGFDFVGFLLCAPALVGLLYGLESVAHANVSHGASAVLVLTGGLLGCAAVRHFRRASDPLLELSSCRVFTYAMATLTAGFLARLSINATPFLLPLMLQVGLGLTPAEAGWMIMAYFIGNLAMKTVTTPTLQRFGFRRVLVTNGVLSGLSIMACALFAPGTSLAPMLVIMLVAGLTRSMQFTALNTLAFADVSAAQRSSASTLSTMMQQVAMILGIAISAMLLGLSQSSVGREVLALEDLRLAFLAIGAISVLAGLQCLRLPGDAGAEVSGHRVSSA